MTDAADQANALAIVLSNAAEEAEGMAAVLADGANGRPDEEDPPSPVPADAVGRRQASRLFHPGDEPDRQRMIRAQHPFGPLEGVRGQCVRAGQAVLCHRRC